MQNSKLKIKNGRAQLNAAFPFAFLIFNF